MTAAGRSFYVPIADNDTSEGAQKIEEQGL